MRRSFTAVTVTVAALGGPVLAGTIEFETGERLQGQIVEVGDEHVVFEHEVLGRLEIDRDRVASIEREEEPDAPDEPAEEPVDEPEPDEPEEPELDGWDTFFEEWDSSITLGFSGTEGNTRSQDVTFRLNMRQDKPTHRWDIESAYFFGRDRGVRSRNEFRAEVTHDWKIPDSPWFLFVTGGYEYNEFRIWRQRWAGHGGVGYTFIDREDFELESRAGLGGTYAVEGPDGFTPEAMFAASVVRWHITENQTLSGGATIYPNLEDRGEFRANANAEWTLSLDRANGMRLRLGLENRHESHPGPDRRRNDFKYYGAVVIDF